MKSGRSKTRFDTAAAAYRSRPPAEVGRLDEILEKFTATPPPVPPATIVPDTTVVPHQGPTVPATTVPADTTVVPLTTVKVVPGYTAIPHTVLDSLWEHLDAYEAKVYMRLLRLSRGYQSETCRVGYDTLATRCKMSRTAVQKATARLVALGLLERLETSYGGERGTLYRVIVPGDTMVASTTVVRRGTVVPGGRDKENPKERVHTRSVEESRRLVAAMRHQLKHDRPDATEAELRAVMEPWAREHGIPAALLDTEPSG